jgi:hypothetical protein
MPGSIKPDRLPARRFSFGHGLTDQADFQGGASLASLVLSRFECIQAESSVYPQHSYLAQS